MLPVLIWSPLEQYSNLISNYCPKCEDNSIDPVSRLVPYGWTNGVSNENQPRLIHCVHFNVILVSRIYRCNNGHRVLAHNPGIIKSFTTGHIRCLLPFHLWHRTGFTVPLLEYVTDMCDSGMSLRHIESTLSSNRLRLYFKQKQQSRHSGTCHSFPSYTADCLEKLSRSSCYFCSISYGLLAMGEYLS